MAHLALIDEARNFYLTIFEEQQGKATMGKDAAKAKPQKKEGARQRSLAGKSVSITDTREKGSPSSSRTRKRTRGKRIRYTFRLPFKKCSNCGEEDQPGVPEKK